MINGVTFDYPETDDVDWGPEATDWASAVTSGMLQKAGGLFQLLAEVDFGTAYGVKSLYYKTRTSNNASAGQYRLARADVVSWRNEANDGDLTLSVDSSDNLLFNGVPIVGSFTTDNTASIDLDLTAQVLTATLNLSVASADAGYINAVNSIEADGLQTQVPIASGSVTGVLSSSDWTTFNNKLSSSLTSANILVGNGSNVAAAVAVTGDIGITNAGVTSYVGIVPLNKGGSNKNMTAVAGGVVYTDADSMEVTAAGTSGQYFKSNGSSAPSWQSFTAPTIRNFTSGSGTYTTPAGVVWIRVRMVGPGGGGASGGSSGRSSGSAGAASTTFGTSLLEAGAGSGGDDATGNGGPGGSASLGTGPIGTAITGSRGDGYSGISAAPNKGGTGGNAPYFSGAGTGIANAAGNNGTANTGGGGGGGGGTSIGGAGGGSGGYVEAIISSPLSSYAYVVGAGGAGGPAGVAGAAGGNGAAGYIEVTEYYQ